MRQLTTPDRRTLLKALSLAPTHAVRVPPAVEAELREAGLISSQVCLLTCLTDEASQTPALLRDDLADGEAGLPMTLRLQVVTDDGVPLPGTRIDLWHQMRTADLSGRQVADATGCVRFRTVFPDVGAPALVHLRLHLITGGVAETTLAFDARLSRDIQAIHQPDDAATTLAPAVDGGVFTPVTPRMTAPDGEMEIALVVGITQAGSESGRIDRILRRA